MKKTLLASLVVLSLLASPLSVLAWAEPGSFPPNNNVGAPIHIGPEAQTKSGVLTIIGNTSATIKGFMVGSNTLILQNATQNLFYGNVDAASQGNLLNLQVEDVTKFIVDKDGDVGVGTETPGAKLHVKTGATAAPFTAGYGLIVENPNKGGATAKNVGIYGIGEKWLNNESAVGVWGHAITSANNVTLYGVYGTVNQGGGAGVNAYAGYFDGRGYFSDNVGIGTAPSAQLHIADIYSAGGKNLLLGDDIFLTDVDIANTLGIYGNQNNDRASIQLGSGGGTITGRNGNIGIGSINPLNSKLEVISGTPAASATFSIAGGAAINAIIYPGGVGPAIQGIAADNSTSGIGVFGSTSKADGKAIYGYSNSATAYAGYFDGVSGKNYFANTVGIGNLNPNPAYKLDVAGDVNITGTYRVNGTPIAVGGGTEWTTSGNDIYNANIGNVGVGVVAPTQKLDIAGDVNITGTYRINGTPIAVGGGTEWTTSGNNISNTNIGNVGIGTGAAIPAAKLNIAGTTGAALKISDGGDIVISPQISGGDTTLYNDNGTLSITTGVNASGNLYTTGNVLANGVLAGAYSSGSGDAVIVGNDSKLVDINIANTMGIYGLQDSTTASIKLGSNGGTLTGSDNGYGPGINTNIFEVSSLINPYEGAGPGGSSDIRIPSGKVATPIGQGNMGWFKGGNFGGGAPAIWWCNQYNRGRMGFYKSDAGVGDRLCYCRRDSGGEYYWMCF